MTTPENRMIVANMSTCPEDFTEHEMYCCPAIENGFHASNKHFPAKYIGNYVSKGVRYIAVVEACVRLNKKSPPEVLWSFGDADEATVIAKAEAVRAATHRNPRPCLVFIQGQLSVTNFEYDSLGGLQGSRTYFDLTNLKPTDVKDLAVKLREEVWSSLPKWKPKATPTGE